MAERADAVVVGAGPNGLAAAITLAEAGRDVVLLEARPHVGGALATAELTLPGFRHDVFSAVHPAGAASPVFAAMPLADHGLEWVHPRVAMSHPLADGSAVSLHRDLEATRASLEAQARGDGDAWAAFAAPLLDAYDALRATMLAGFPPVGGALRLLRALGPAGTLDFGRLALMSAEALAGELFASDGARAWLYGSTVHGDVPPSGAGSAIFAVYLDLLGHAVGWPSPRGGSGALADALASHLTALGGSIRTGAPVERVVVEGGAAAGVVLAGGERIEARRVLCDVSPRALVALTGQTLPAGYRRRMAAWRHGPGTVKVDWALAAPIPWTAEEVRGAGTVHVGGGAAGIERFARMSDGDELPDEPFMLLGQQSLADPARAPEGRQTGWAYTHVPNGTAFADGGEALADRMEAYVESFAPGFRETIMARHVLAPGELEARDANLVGGDVGGGSLALDQLVFRPVPSLSPYRTPLDGLYLASASAFPGGAVHGVCGAAAARAALTDARLARVGVRLPGRWRTRTTG